MMKALALMIALASLATGAAAEVVVAARLLPAGTILVADDLLLVPGNRQSTFADMAGLVGQQVRATVYSGHPVMAAQIGAPIVVERNTTVSAVYYNNGLVLAADARALDSAAAGEVIRVLNLTSHKVLSGLVQADGTVVVTGSQIPLS